MASPTTAQELLGSNLRRFRGFLNLTQSKLAEKCELSTNFVNELENGKGWVSAESLDRICRELGIEHYRLFAPDSLPEVANDSRVLDCIDDMEAETRKALASVREKFVGRSRG